jgi:hypothetical protein
MPKLCKLSILGWVLILVSQVLAFQSTNGLLRKAPSIRATPEQKRTKLYMSVPVLDKWITLPNGSISGTIYNSMDPEIQDGDVISTSPMKHPELAGESTLVETWSGTEYLLMKSASVGAMGSNSNTKSANGDNVKDLLKQVKDAGISGAISYALWELAFWTISVPVCAFAFRQVFGQWPDLSNKEDLGKLGTEALVFVNVARFAVPVRIGLALTTVPWVKENIVDTFIKNDGRR